MIVMSHFWPCMLCYVLAGWVLRVCVEGGVDQEIFFVLNLKIPIGLNRL